ncbi:MAG: PLP-dependent aminotransferase family protein [Acidobacteria bacterium]|nr:PLP-dependent aminotransferase family protein [Acidobacteriota bacterium]
MIPLPQLDQNSDEPIYRQLHARIKASIQDGSLAPGERIPPTRELAGLLGLNRTTVAAAYELLESEGLIRGHVGRGSFVAGPSDSNPAASPGAMDWEDRFVANRAPDPPVPAAAPGTSLISFTSARPAAELFPLTEFRAACREVIDGPQAVEILQLGSPLGYAPLRAYLQVQKRDDEDLLITNGCQQALDLLQRLFTRPGDCVLVEDPIYPGLRNVFAHAGVRIVGVPVGPDGLDVDALPRLIARERPRLMVVTPSFQNPTGATMPLAARQALLRIARDNHLVLVENDIYAELRYQGAELPSLKQMDDSGDTIQMKSFSKLAFPGLRVGWVTGPRPVIGRLAELKQWTDLHSDQLSQAVLLRFAQSGSLESHRQRMVEAGRARLHAVLSACERYLPQGSRFTRPQGGMNLWVRLPDPLDASELLPRAQRAGVSFLPGRYFAVSRQEPGALRLSFAGLPPEQIETGLAILGRVCQEELAAARAAQSAGLAPVIV